MGASKVSVIYIYIDDIMHTKFWFELKCFLKYIF